MRPGTVLLRCGAAMVGLALLLSAFNLWDANRAGEAAERALEEIRALPAPKVTPTPREEAVAAASAVIADYELDPEREMPTAEVEGERYVGVLSIPALELELPVMAEWSYPRLRKAPCRYAGTAYRAGFVIAAHNYSAHFGRIDELRPGDRVVFTDVDGSGFAYDVVEVQTLAPTAVEEMLDEAWDLTLFTCTLGGATRIAVRCAAA